MSALRKVQSVVTSLSLLLQASGLAHASPPQSDVQPVPYAPSQPVPIPAPPVTASSPSAPNAPSGDAVYLRQGGVVRGAILEMVPNDHVTLIVPGGQRAVVQWSTIEHIERAAGTPLAPLGSRAPRAAVPDPGGVVVHLDADPGVVLEGIAPGSGRWALMCAAPCDTVVPLGRLYRAVGPSIRPSRAFSINAPPGQRVTLSIDGGSRGAFAGGLVLSSIGGAAIVAGLTVILLGFVGNCDGDGSCSPDGNVETAGAIVSLVGVGFVIGGVVLAVANARSHATQTVTGMALEPPTRPETAWLRVPQWSDGLRAVVAAPKTEGVPLLRLAF